MSAHVDSSHGQLNYLNHEKGLWSWLTTLDHKRIGLMYLVSLMFFFAVGGIAALIMRLELAKAGATLGISSDAYNTFFTVHGAVMIFLYIET